jgi:hypothetical protein
LARVAYITAKAKKTWTPSQPMAMPMAQMPTADDAYWDPPGA